MPKKHDIIELELYVHHETGKAWLVSEDGVVVKGKEIWLAKSQAEMGAVVAHASGGQKPVHEFSLPEWLALEKGLL